MFDEKKRVKRWNRVFRTEIRLSRMIKKRTKKYYKRLAEKGLILRLTIKKGFADQE